MENWTSIDRIGFVFHDPSIRGTTMFLNDQPLFTPDKDDSENLVFLIDLIKTLSVKHVDFLACNTLKYPNWKSFYDTLAKKSGAIIGASDNETGNQKYGGDWIMENTREDIVNIYFKGAIIMDFKGTLASTISSSTSLDPSFLQTSSNWPITVTGGTSTIPTVITITGNATIPINSYFDIQSPYVVIDGGGYTLTVNISLFNGLIQNGTSATTGYSHVTIQNIKVNGSGGTLNDNQGWICATYFGHGGIDNVVTNCSSSGNIGSRSGGIFGSHAGYDGGSIIAINCSSSGNIDYRAGGIFGYIAGHKGGTATAINCYSTGQISSDLAGGIFGSTAGGIGGTVIASNCYSTGSIINYGGGIFGFAAGYLGGIATATNCYSLGNISGDLAGGIFGGNAGEEGTATASNCFSTGPISGGGAGGITGDWFGVNTNNTCSLINCYSLGNILGDNAGGICGAEVGYNDSYNSPLFYIPKVVIQNCYTWGSIGSTAGGFCGGAGGNTYTNTPIVSIVNSYILQSGSFIASSLQIIESITLQNTYAANGSWNDASAIAPGALDVSNGVWTDINLCNTSTPFLLSAYNSAIYNPSTASTCASCYNSPPGLYKNYCYKLINVSICDPNVFLSLINTKYNIDASTGVVTFQNLQSYQYTALVLAYQLDSNKNIYGYEINTFVLDSKYYYPCTR